MKKMIDKTQGAVIFAQDSGMHLKSRLIFALGSFPGSSKTCGMTQLACKECPMYTPPTNNDVEFANDDSDCDRLFIPGLKGAAYSIWFDCYYLLPWSFRKKIGCENCPYRLDEIDDYKCGIALLGEIPGDGFEVPQPIFNDKNYRIVMRELKRRGTPLPKIPEIDLLMFSAGEY